MTHSQSETSPIRYGRTLINAGLTGILIGQNLACGDRSLSAVAAEAAQDSLAFALIGASFGLLSSCVINPRKRLLNAAALGSLGSALGFIAVFGWNTRNVLSSVVHSAARELRKARDEHWLELNPIDFA
jgi:hypothetical protein